MPQESVTALFTQADALQQEGKLTEAIASYRRAIELNPRFSWSHHHLGEALAAQEDWLAATKAFRRAIEINPNLAHSHYRLGQVLAQQGQLSEAIASYQKAIEIHPHFAEFHNSLGEAFAQQGKPDKAVASYQTALDIDPDYDEAYLNWGETLATQGKLDEALQQINIALRLNPGNWRAYHKLAEIQQQKNQLTEAIASYQKAIQLKPDSNQSHHKLGRVLAQLERWTEAIKSYQKASQLEPNSAAIYHQWGHALAKQENWNKAIAQYQKALKLSSDSAVVHLHLGEAFCQLQQWEKAIAAFGQAIKIDPDFELAHHQLGQCYLDWGQVYWDKKQWSDAVEIYRQAIKSSRPPAAAYEKLGDALRKAGTLDLKEVYRCYQKALKLNPNHVELAQKALEIQPEDTELKYLLASAFVNTHQSHKAVEIYEKLLKIQPNDLDWNLKLGEAFVRVNALDKAISCYKTVLELDPESSKSYHLLGEALQKQGKLEKALEAYKTAIELDPKFFGSYHNIGDVFRQQEELEAAKEAYQKAVELNPNFYWSYHNLGGILEQQGQLEAAIKAYRQALKVNPNFAYSYLNLGTLLARQGKIEEAIACRKRAGELDPSFALDTQAIQQILLPKPAVADPMYQLWREQNEPRESDLRRMAETVDILGYQPIISVILPVFNTPDQYLKAAIDSVINQVYSYWELCIADDASTNSQVKPLLDEYAAKDSRIKVSFRPENGHISEASNSALELATGEFICLLDHDDVLTPDALYEVALLLNRYRDADMIYSDEDKISPDGQLVNPYFKSEWCPESFLSRMYTCHLGTYRRSLVEEVGGWRVGYEGAQDYDLVLRLTEKTDKIYHIPKVLYHWRMHAGSAAGGTGAKPYAYKASLKALQDAIERRGEKGKVYGVTDYLGHHLVRYEIEEYKKVSIIIPTRDLAEDLERCLFSIFTISTYPNYEVILIDNGSVKEETFEVISKWSQKEPQRFKCYPLDIQFNFSKLNNYGVTQAEGEYLLFLNNDTEVVTPDWIEAMVEQVQRPQIGAVGALLLFPDNTVQHAGVVMGLGGIAGHSYYRMTSKMPGYFGNLIGFNNVSAVTGACLMCRRDVFEQVGGLDEALTVAYNDVDLCLKMLERGYRNLYLPHVVLYHHESKSRGYEDSPEKKARLKQESQIMEQRWKKYIDNDPCYSPHLTRVCQNYSIRV